MKCYCIITKDNDKRPSYFYLKNGEKELSFAIFNKGSGLKLKDALNRLDKATELILWAGTQDLRTNNYKDLIDAFELSLFQYCHNIRDYGLNSIKTSNSEEKDLNICRRYVQLMDLIGDKPYQHLLSGAQQVYSNIAKNGLYLNYTKMFPEWSWDTFSGRSRCTGFNIQGLSTNDIVYQPSVQFNNIQIQFDWICADINVASILSNDDSLRESFAISDPYTYLSHKICGSDKIREESKLLLLKTINNLDYNNEYINMYFPKLSEWLKEILYSIKKNGYSTNIVGRRFSLIKDRTERSILNAIMQGSVASAMQSAIIEIYKKFPNYILTDIHDSIVLCVPNDSKIVSHVIKEVGIIFLRPFKNVLNNDYLFPYRVSIGNRWKCWDKCFEVRN